MQRSFPIDIEFISVRSVPYMLGSFFSPSHAVVSKFTKDQIVSRLLRERGRLGALPNRCQIHGAILLTLRPLLVCYQHRFTPGPNLSNPRQGHVSNRAAAPCGMSSAPNRSSSLICNGKFMSWCRSWVICSWPWPIVSALPL